VLYPYVPAKEVQICSYPYEHAHIEIPKYPGRFTSVGHGKYPHEYKHKCREKHYHADIVDRDGAYQHVCRQIYHKCNLDYPEHHHGILRLVFAARIFGYKFRRFFENIFSVVFNNGLLRHTMMP
jgi:hypothetical protein